jgi:hypothetical protein
MCLNIFSLGDSEIQYLTPLEGVTILVATPSEAGETLVFLELKMWWNFISVKISRIPIVVRRTRNHQINPLGSVLGCYF